MIWTLWEWNVQAANQLVKDLIKWHLPAPEHDADALWILKSFQLQHHIHSNHSSPPSHYRGAITMRKVLGRAIYIIVGDKRLVSYAFQSHNSIWLSKSTTLHI